MVTKIQQCQTTISSPATLKCISKRKKIYNWEKIDMRKLTKGSARTVHGPKKPVERTMHHMRDCVGKNPCTPMNDTFMVLVGPSPTSRPAPNLI